MFGTSTRAGHCRGDAEGVLPHGTKVLGSKSNVFFPLGEIRPGINKHTINKAQTKIS